MSRPETNSNPPSKMSAVKMNALEPYTISIYDSRYKHSDYEHAITSAVIRLFDDVNIMRRIHGAGLKWCYRNNSDEGGWLLPRKPFNFVSLDDNDIIRKVKTFSGMYVILAMEDGVDCGMTYGMFKIVEIGFP